MALFLFIMLFCTSNLVAQETNIFTQTWYPKNYKLPQSSTKIILNEDKAKTVISFNKDGVINKIPPTLFGSNTTFRNGSNQLDRLDLYKNKIKVFRYPAGSGSNLFFFDGEIPTQVSKCFDKKGNELLFSGINGSNKRVMHPQIFAEFKIEADAEAIVVVNYFYARYGITKEGTREARVKQAAQYAAQFVRKMNIELGANIKYWEVGNECYGAWEHGFDVEGLGTLTGKEYGEDFAVFVEYMKAVDPSIKIGAVLTKDKEEVGGVDTNASIWNKEVIETTKNCADFFILHEYFTTTKDATLENLQANVTAIKRGVEQVKNTIREYGNNNMEYPLAMTEFNSRGAYNCSFYNAQFISQVMCEQIKEGVSLATSWASEWKWDEAARESKSLFALNDPDQADYTPRPTYLPYYYFEKCMGDRLVDTSSNDSDLKVYASTFSSGEVGLVIVNISGQNKYFNINTNNKLFECDWYHCYAPTIDVNQNSYKRFYINEQTIGYTQGGGPILKDVAPYNAVINSNSKFEIHANGIIYMTLKKQDLSSITNLNHSAAIVYLNDRSLYTSAEITNVFLTDLASGFIIRTSGHANSGFIFDLSDLSSNVYLVNYTHENHKVTQKILLP